MKKVTKKKIVKLYRYISITVFSGTLFFLFLNLLAGGVIVTYLYMNKAQMKGTIPLILEKSYLKQVYPSYSDKEIKALLNETWTGRAFVYEPFTQFKERSYSGHYINVDTAGFRKSKNQGPWPIDRNNFNIFLFGGSTTFGYGVADEHTIASFLQEIIASHIKQPVCVYNFGRGFYYYSQERVLFEKLLLQNAIPDMAIFIDGLNASADRKVDKPPFSHRFKQYIDKLVNKSWLSDKKRKIQILTERMPAVSLFKILRDLKNTKKDLTAQSDWYFTNKRIIEQIAAVYSVKPVFVWQPVSLYKYDQTYLDKPKDNANTKTPTYATYEAMSQVIKQNPPGNNFFWLADMQKHSREPLYVDGGHYSAKMNREVAAAIIDMIYARNIIEQTD